MDTLMILDETLTGETINQLWEQLQAINWTALISAIVNVILFIISTIYAVRSKVNNIKVQEQNDELQAEHAKLDGEYKAKELALQKKYTDDVADMKKALLQRVDDNAKLAEIKNKSESVQISGSIQKAQASLDELLDPTKASK